MTHAFQRGETVGLTFAVVAADLRGDAERHAAF